MAQKGTEHRDELTPGEGFTSNNSGGVLGGISSGQDISRQPGTQAHLQLCVSLASRSTSLVTPAEVVTTGRHDPCVGIRAVPIAEAMLAITLMDHYLRHRGQNADVDSGLEPI